MQSSVPKKDSKPCNCHYCCLNPLLSFSNSLDHQNSAKINNSSTFRYDFATSTTSSLYPHTQFTNPESLPNLSESFRYFTRAFPQFLNTVQSDQIRSNHYPNLGSSNVCLDYTGYGLFSFSQQQEEVKNAEFLASSSSTPHSKLTQFEISHKANSTEFDTKIMERIMRYLNISEDDYSMFLTANQTSAFGVLAEFYPFQSNKSLVTVYDHENEAVEAMIDSSRNRGARVCSAEFKWPKFKIHSAKLEDKLLEGNKKKKKKKERKKGLFVFPIQSRVSGTRYSYQWMSMAQENGWHVLLDATSLGPKDMDTLGLSFFRPDFLICTFYKVFGEDPSGFACLFVKKSIAQILNNFNTSSVNGIVSLIGQDNGLKLSTISNSGSKKLVDVKLRDSEIEEFGIECRGLDHADSLGLVLIGTRARCLINWLVNALLALKHPNSERVVQLVVVYGPRVRFDRGPALAFNVFDWKGERVDPLLVQKLAGRNNISVGCGFIKNLWFSERYEEEKRRVLEKTSRESGIPVITASLGFLTNFEDVYRLWVFVSKFLDADFIEKERWRYAALNQKSSEV